VTNSPATRDGTTPALQIRLLGSAEILRNDQPVAGFRSVKAQALLYYLSAAGRPVARATLVGLFWADQAEDQARINLNQTLSNLRKVMGDALDITRQTAAFAAGHTYFLDTEQLAYAARHAQSLDVDALLAAAALYRGELLEGFQVRDAAEFEVWLQAERERLRQTAVTVLVEAARRCEQASDTPRAEQALRALLRIEPWRESAHRQLMLLLARSGARDAALAQYVACKQALAAALDVEPDDETNLLYQRIRSGQIAADGARTASPPAATEMRQAGNDPGIKSPRNPEMRATPPTTTPPPHNLREPATPFVGRARELAKVLELLPDPQCRLLTLVGPGGIGKSRLAQQAALALVHDAEAHDWLADGIYFVPLATAETPGELVAAVADAAGFQFYNNAPAQQQLVSFLHAKRMLLVLDNFEPLLAGDGANLVLEWVSDVLAQAIHLKLLVTTREALGLQEAWFFPLAGLSLPAGERMGDDGDPAADLEQSDAVQLFLQSARRARVGFSLSTTLNSVTRICRLVDGTPLGIELAAAWLKVLTAEQVAAELERSIDILTARNQNVPVRHRSMRAVCESSWQLLGESLRAVMRRLSFCRGGFHLQAAAELAGASILDLATLVEKSLLRQTETGRYEMHETLRQYALERLASRQEVEELRRSHAAYYLDFLQQRSVQLTGPLQRQALDELAAEQENLHLAWHSAVDGQDWELVGRAHAALFNLLQVRSAYLVGQELFTLAADRLQVVARAEDAPEMLCRLWTHIRARQGAFAFYLGDYARAAELANDSLDEAQQLSLAADCAFALNMLGQIAGWQGERDRARECLNESLRTSRELGDRAGVANTLHKLAQVQGSVGEYAEARRLAQESLDVCQQLGRPDWIGYGLDVLGWVTLCLGDYAACKAHYDASLRLFREIGDRLGTALALGGLGSVEWARGGERLLPAAAYMTKSLNLCRSIGHRHHAASRLWYLGQIALEQEDYWLARSYAEEGKALAEEVGSRVFVAYNLCSLGEALGGLGHPAQAHVHLVSVLRIASEVAHLPPLLIALIGLARLYLRGGQGHEQESAPSERMRLAQASLQVVIEHPSCWHPYRVRAQQLAQELAAHTGEPLTEGAQPPSLAEVVAAWQELDP
jgi:predicted ATPase/DNA-binding SARP family transcriptional activator